MWGRRIGEGRRTTTSAEGEGRQGLRVHDGEQKGAAAVRQHVFSPEVAEILELPHEFEVQDEQNEEDEEYADGAEDEALLIHLSNHVLDRPGGTVYVRIRPL